MRRRWWRSKNAPPTGEGGRGRCPAAGKSGRCATARHVAGPLGDFLGLQVCVGLDGDLRSGDLRCVV